MTVWVVFTGICYEGETLQGIFSTKEAADRCGMELAAQAQAREIDWVSVCPWEVEE